MKCTKQDLKTFAEAYNLRLQEFLLDAEAYKRSVLATITEHDFKTKRDLDFFKETAFMGFNHNMRNFLDANEAMDKLSEEAKNIIRRQGN